MRKLLIFTAAAVLMLIGIWGSLMLYFDEPRLKQIAVEQVRLQTGRELVIDGPLNLDLFPRVALNAQQVRLSGPENYIGPDLFAADEFSMSLSLLKLIQGEVETGNIELNGAQISLHTDRAGISTLDGLLSTETRDPDASALVPPPLTTGTILLSNVSLLLSDEASNEAQRFLIDRLQIEQFNFNQATPFVFEGQVGEPPVVEDLRITGSITVPSRAGAITIDQFSLTAMTSAIELELDGIVQINPGPPLRAQFSDGELVLDDQRYAVSFSFSFTEGTRPLIEASLAGEMMDIDQLLADMAPAAEAEQDAAASPLQLFKDIDLNATLALEALRVSGLLLSDINAQMIAKDGILTLDPLSGALAGGAMSAVARVNLNVTPAVIQLQPSFTLSALDQALAPWGLDRFVSGAGDLDLNLTAEGLSPTEILSSLTGQGQYDFRDGTIKGINLDGMVQGLADRNIAAAVSAGVGGTTQFSQFTGPLEINDGMIRLPNIELVSQLLGVRGDVFLNIGDLSLDGNLRLDNERFNSITLALGGTLLQPQLTPDVSGALREEAGRRVLDLFQRRLNDDDEDEQPEDNGGGGEGVDGD